MKRPFKNPRVGKGEELWSFSLFLSLGLLIFFFLFTEVPGEARDKVPFFGNSSENVLFEEALKEAWGEAFPSISLGNLEPFPQGIPPSAYLSLPSSSEELFLGILSLRELVLLLPEALSLGTPFLFYSSGAVELFFEQSRYWERLRERFRESTALFLAGPAEGGGFLVVVDRRKAREDLLPLGGAPYGASWEAEAAVLYGFEAKPVLLPPRENLGALLQGNVAGGMLPLENLDSPFWEEFEVSLLLSSGLYDLRFLVLSSGFRERLGEEGLSRLEETLERANRRVRQYRESETARILGLFKERGFSVQELSLKEQAPFAMAARRAYGPWLETKISRSWIDLPLQEAQDANSMAGGQ